MPLLAGVGVSECWRSTDVGIYTGANSTVADDVGTVVTQPIFWNGSVAVI